MTFWIIIAVITLVVCLVGFYPLFKKNTLEAKHQRDLLNKTFYLPPGREPDQSHSCELSHSMCQAVYQICIPLLPRC